MYQCYMFYQKQHSRDEREIQQRKYSTRKMYTFTVVIVVRGAVEVRMVMVW